MYIWLCLKISGETPTSSALSSGTGVKYNVVLNFKPSIFRCYVCFPLNVNPGFVNTPGLFHQRGAIFYRETRSLKDPFIATAPNQIEFRGRYGRSSREFSSMATSKW